jgi:hypothetical protein
VRQTAAQLTAHALSHSCTRQNGSNLDDQTACRAPPPVSPTCLASTQLRLWAGRCSAVCCMSVVMIAQHCRTRMRPRRASAAANRIARALAPSTLAPSSVYTRTTFCNPARRWLCLQKHWRLSSLDPVLKRLLKRLDLSGLRSLLSLLLVRSLLYCHCGR